MQFATFLFCLFTDMDFVWGIGARDVLYNPIIASMELYDKLTRLG